MAGLKSWIRSFLKFLIDCAAELQEPPKRVEHPFQGWEVCWSRISKSWVARNNDVTFYSSNIEEVADYISKYEEALDAPHDEEAD